MNNEIHSLSDAPLPPASLSREAIAAAGDLRGDFVLQMQLFAPWEARPKLAIAVSGGVDSLALFWLAKAWVEARNGSLLALTVDHGLRPESSAEAEAVARLIRQAGVEHRILRWEGAKPSSGLQAAARDARYRLLDRACGEAGILHLLIAHHADDQQETLHLRKLRGSTEWGLTGMPAERMLNHCRLLRPLLTYPKAALIEWMRTHQHSWWEDASNQQPVYARNRLRLSGEMPADARPSNHKAFFTRGNEMRKLAQMASKLRYGPDAAVQIPEALWQDLSQAMQKRLLSRLLLQLSGSDQPPRQSALQDACARMESGWTLQGILCHRTGAGYLLHREPAAVAANADLLRAGYRQIAEDWQIMGLDRATAYRQLARSTKRIWKDWPIQRLAALPTRMDNDGRLQTVLDAGIEWLPKLGLSEWQFFLPPID